MKLLTVRETAEALSVSPSLVYRLVSEGALRCFRIGKGALRFREEDIQEYLNRCVVEVGLGSRQAASSKPGRPFKHLDAERLLDSWHRQGVRIGRQGERTAQTSE